MSTCIVYVKIQKKNAARAPFTFLANSVELPKDESHPTISKQENKEHGD